MSANEDYHNDAGRIAQLRRENAALKARVAELESKMALTDADFAALNERETEARQAIDDEDSRSRYGY